MNSKDNNRQSPTTTQADRTAQQSQDARNRAIRNHTRDAAERFIWTVQDDRAPQTNRETVALNAAISALLDVLTAIDAAIDAEEVARRSC